MTDKKFTEDDARIVANAVETLLPIVDVLLPVIKAAIKTFTKIWHTVLYCYPNKRVVWLALHHPKERVRKKNIKRIMRWIERESKNDEK